MCRDRCEWLRSEGQSLGPVGDGDPRGAPGGKLPEPPATHAPCGWLPRTGKPCGTPAALRHFDETRARNPQDAGGRQVRERDRHGIRPKCEDCRGAQVQPDAQAGYPQQSPTGTVRHSEEGHPAERACGCLERVRESTCVSCDTRAAFRNILRVNRSEERRGGEEWGS